MNAMQDEMFEPTIAQRFARWKDTPGGGQLLNQLYRLTAGYYRRFEETGRGVSPRLLWELLRDSMSETVEAPIARESGYLLNDHFTAHAIRHMISSHEEWGKMFQLRELGARKAKRKITVVEFQ